ncbi:hypothetical protein ACSHMG_19015 [Bacillus [licheniformis] CMCC 63516]|uniref:hypothetical protein n=1 Tax=Bacillus paralicheniformis TaxID=1648923 RepID=UPI0013749CD2|nr:hypothetical protein [Bacillus paralicheniformis]WOH90471.1 hypothetical protein RZN08_17830 [Bacillus paralicheniformis]
MGILILSIIVAVIFAGAFISDMWGFGPIECILGILFGSAVGALVFVIGFIPAFFLQDEPVNPHKTEIYSIKDNSNTKGSFILGSGAVDEEQYFYYVVEKDSFKSVDKAKVKDSKMKEGDIEQPYVVTYEMQFKSAIARFFYGKYTGEKTYEFYLPENTITTDYKIDLE